MFLKSAQLVSKNVLQKGRTLMKITSQKQARFLSFSAADNEYSHKTVLTSQDIDKIVSILPVGDDNKLLIEKLSNLKKDLNPAPAEAQELVDVQGSLDKLKSYLTSFENFQDEAAEDDRTKEIEFLGNLLNLLDRKSVNGIPVVDLMQHIVLQSVMRPGGNHCPDEYFELLFKVLKINRTIKLSDLGCDIWGFEDFNNFRSVTLNGPNIVKFLKKNGKYESEWRAMCHDIVDEVNKSKFDQHMKDSALLFFKSSWVY